VTTIAALYRYPVKSMGGERLQRAEAGPAGFAGDHRFGIVEVSTGAIASAKRPKKWGTLLSFSARYVSEPRLGQVLPAVEITFPDGSVHRSDEPGVHAHLSQVLGTQVRLIQQRPSDARCEAVWGVVEGHSTNERIRRSTVGKEGRLDLLSFGLAKAVPETGDGDSFVDAYPIHILTTGSLRHLEDLTPGVPFDHRRFRPNLLLETAEVGFVEQEWAGRTIWAGDVGFTITIPTARCAMPVLQHAPDVPHDGRQLRAIARHNTLELPELGGRWNCVGVYAVLASSGTVAVGSSVCLEDERPAAPIGTIPASPPAAFSGEKAPPAGCLFRGKGTSAGVSGRRRPPGGAVR
jgi:uncharacterized protein YcbX